MKLLNRVCDLAFPMTLSFSTLAFSALTLSIQPISAAEISLNKAELSKLVAFGNPTIGGFPQKMMESAFCKQNPFQCYVIKQHVLTQEEWDNEVEAKIRGNRNPITKRRAVQKFCVSRYGKDFHSITLLGRAACNYKEVYIPPGSLL
jgi:hypothetical protein